VRFSRILVIFPLFALILSGCLSPQISQSEVTIPVSITADGETRELNIPAGNNVQQALDSAGLKTGGLDKVEPPLYTVVSAGLSIKITRGREKFETKQTVIPFERQMVRNESMPLGEEQMIQPGKNGLQEVVYRSYYEDGLLVNTSISRSAILEPSIPEIVMVGVQAPFAPLAIPGKLVYLAGGNAWLMEGSTSNRTPLVTTGDLDGRVLRLSPDGKWLLYTRKSSKPADQEINTLWALNITDPKATPINMRTSNIVHFADWDPKASLTILYSTVEPRAAAPGWQANNDLYRMKFGDKGALGAREKIVEANTGGVYGWWGTDYAWSPTGNLLAYSRPDGMGIVSFREKTLLPLLEITPLQTRSDWALIPPVSWGADGQTLFVVTHAPPPGLVNPEESPNFDLNATLLDLDTIQIAAQVRIAQQSGMFAYPSASQASVKGAELAYYVAYLQALSPTQSETSGYRLVLMDRDGSNRRTVFPDPGSPGLDPQTPVWAPAAPSFVEGDFVVVLYEGNLWMIDAATGKATQVTGDGLIQKIDWK
jgi:dipeptidyl aminopeptidase/acylaminoacyl peptidase